MQIDTSLNLRANAYDGYTSVSNASSETNILVASNTDQKDIVHKIESSETKPEHTTIKKSNEPELRENLQKLQDTMTQIGHQISKVEHLNDETSKQMLHHFNIAQADIQTNILSVKTKISEVSQD